MASRLWSNPPLNADGDLDYPRLTVAEIHEDLGETLSDLVFNANKVHLVPLLGRLGAARVRKRARARVEQPPEQLVLMMEELRRVLQSDTYLKTDDALRLLSALVEFFERGAKGRS